MRFILLLLHFCIGAFANDDTNFTPDMADRLALVHVRPQPFDETMIPGNRSTDPSMLVDPAVPQTRSTLHFCLNSMVPDLPKDQEADTPSGFSWDATCSYAIILPLTAELLKRSPCYTLNDISIFGPLKLPDTAIFVYPQESKAAPVGITEFYDTETENLRDALNRILEKNNKIILQHRYESNDIHGGAYLEGKKLIPPSLFECFGLDSRAPVAHSQSLLFNLEQLVREFSVMTVFFNREFEARAEKGFDKGACHLVFNLGTVLSHVSDLEEVIQISEVILDAMHAPQETWALMRHRFEDWRTFEKIWQLERQMMLEQKRSSLLAPRFSHTFAKRNEIDWPSLVMQLHSIAVPFDLQQSDGAEDARKVYEISLQFLTAQTAQETGRNFLMVMDFHHHMSQPTPIDFCASLFKDSNCQHQQAYELLLAFYEKFYMSKSFQEKSEKIETDLGGVRFRLI